ncbi:MAG: HEAT repeat domain-containing protein [Candidatus Riflebacteria bacterium]|nr:HEAT repeat domain-containing protein [Candidatus Riflebacteria bacterium]
MRKVFLQILNFIASNDPDLKKCALLTLARLKGESAAHVLFEKYQSDNLEDYLALVVNKIDPEQSSKFLIAALSDPNPEARLMAAGALAKERREASVATLTDIIEAHLDPSKVSSKDAPLLSNDALILAVRALGDIGSQACVSLLRKFVLSNASSKVKASAIAALSLHVNDQMIQIFQGLLKDNDSRVRANAVEALGYLNNPATVGVLQPFLFDSHQRVKANAAKAIWKYGDYEVTSTLKEMLSHPVKAQRVSGIYAVGEIKPQAFVRQLLSFLSDPDADIRRHAVIAIKKLGPSEHALKLIPMLSDRDNEVQKEVIKALTDVYGEGALGALVKHLQTEASDDVKSLLIEKIGHYGKENVIPQLTPFLEMKSESLIVASLKAISQISSGKPQPQIVNIVKQFLSSDLSDKVRAAALKVLWQWGCQEALEVVTDFVMSGKGEKTVYGLKSMADIFEAASAEGGEILELFETSLKEAVEIKRQNLQGSQNELLKEKIVEKMNQAQTFIQFNQLEDAESLLKEILSIDPKSLSAIVALADILFKANRITEAAELFETALSIQPNLVKAYYALGQIYSRLGVWSKATSALFATIQLHPKLPQAYLLLAESLENENKIPQMIDVLKKLLTMVPKNEKVMSKLARALFISRNFNEGIGMARQAVTLGARDLSIAMIQSVGEIHQKNYADGIKRLFRLIRVVLENPDTQTVNELRKLSAVAEEVVLGIMKQP